MYTFGVAEKYEKNLPDVRLWCTVFHKECKNIKPEDRKPFCHGYCASCSESEEFWMQLNPTI